MDYLTRPIQDYLAIFPDDIIVAPISDSFPDLPPLEHALDHFSDNTSCLTSRTGLSRNVIRDIWGPLKNFPFPDAPVGFKGPKITRDCGVTTEDLDAIVDENAHWLHTLHVLCLSPSLKVHSSRRSTTRLGGKAHASIINAALERASLFTAARKSKSPNPSLPKQCGRVRERPRQVSSLSMALGQSLSPLPSNLMDKLEGVSAGHGGGRRGRRRSSSHSTHSTTLTKADLCAIVRDERKRSLLNGEEVDKWSSDTVNCDGDESSPSLHISSSKRLARSGP